MAISDAAMRRIHSANLAGTSIKDLARSAGVSYVTLVRALGAWRTARKFKPHTPLYKKRAAWSKERSGFFRRTNRTMCEKETDD